MRKLSKVIIVIVGSLLVLLLGVALVFHTRFTKRLLRNQLQDYLAKKTNTEIHIQDIDYHVPSWIQMEGVFIRDKGGDTLLFGRKLRVDMDMLKLFSGDVEIEGVELDGIHANVVRKQTDSTFNYQFLINSFVNAQSTVASEADTTNLKFTLNHVSITQSTFNWADGYGGLDMRLSVGNLGVDMDKIDLKTQEYFIRKGDFNRVVMYIRQGRSLAPTDPNTPKSSLPLVKVDDMKMTDSKVYYWDTVNNFKNANDLKEAQIKELTADLNKNQISINDVKLRNSFIAADKNKPTEVLPTVLPKVLSDAIESEALKVTVKQAELVNNALTYNDNTQPRQQRGIDYYHLLAKKLTVKASNIFYQGDNLGANISQGSLTEQSGVTVNALSGKIGMTDKVIMAEDLSVKTPQSRVIGDVRIYRAALGGISRSGEINEIRLVNNVIGKRDIELFVPSLAKYFNEQLRGAQTLYLTTEARGTAKNLKINRLALYTNRRDAYLDVLGSISQPFDPDRIAYNLRFRKATFQRSFLQPFIPVGTEVRLPAMIALSGTAQGTLNQVRTNLKAMSEFGIATLQGVIKNLTNPDQLIYDATLNAENLQTGRWIAQDSLLGTLNGKIYLKGQGLDYRNAAISSELNIQSLRYLKHVYQNVVLNVNGRNGIYTYKGYSNDPELIVRLSGDANLRGTYPIIHSVIDLDKANLYAMGLYEEPLTLATHATINLNNLDPKLLDASVIMDSTLAIRGSQRFFLDSLVARGNVENGRTFLKFNSILTDASLEGDFDYTDLDNVFKHIAATYQGKKPAPLRNKADIVLNAVVKPSPMYEQVVKGLYFNRPMTANGVIDADADSTVKLAVSVPYLRYNQNTIDDLLLKINGTRDSLKFVMTSDTLRSSNFFFYQTSARGSYSQNAFMADASTRDEKGRERYALGLTALLNDNETTISLKNRLLLNYANWNVSDKNQVRLNDAGFNVRDFELSHANQKIAAESIESAISAPIKLKIENFKLDQITGIINKDSLLVNGTLNADLQAEDFNSKIPTLDGTVTIDSLVYQQIPVGDLEVKVRAEHKNVVMTGKLTGNGNTVDINGRYTPENLNIDVSLNPLQIKSIEPFSLGYLVRSQGKLTGNLNIQGTPSQPLFNGSVFFDSVTTTLKPFGTYINIDKQRVGFNSPVISFSNFVVKDSLNQVAMVNGDIINDTEKGFQANLLVTARNFTALNSQPNPEAEYYGKAIVDADMQVKGDLLTPDVTGNVKVKEDSKITYVREREVPGLKDREGVMAFVDMDTIQDVRNVPMVELADVGKQTSKEYRSEFLTYNLNLDIDRKAEFNIIIDPYTGDQLNVAGAATLNAGINPNGSLMLTGAYNLAKGKYTLNYQFIKREFELQDGSTIIFKGAPTDAETDITAVYEVETRPIDLIRNEITAIGTADKLYQQKMPFLVVLKITGSLMEPKLAFDIKLKENIAGLSSTMANVINNKLTQLRYDASSINKQVFALLVMNRFFGEQARDFFAGGGSSPQDIVKESVSRFLSDAVNQIAADLIKGVDLNVNLRSVDDYASAARRTDLDLALSKRFLNDRMSVTVGKNFTLEGEDPLAKSQNNSSVNFLPDINTSYKLSKDGKYMMRAYRRNQYEAILDGYFIETGLVFSFSLDYDHARELLFWKKPQP